MSGSDQAIDTYDLSKNCDKAAVEILNNQVAVPFSGLTTYLACSTDHLTDTAIHCYTTPEKNARPLRGMKKTVFLSLVVL